MTPQKSILLSAGRRSSRHTQSPSLRLCVCLLFSSFAWILIQRYRACHARASRRYGEGCSDGKGPESRDPCVAHHNTFRLHVIKDYDARRTTVLRCVTLCEDYSPMLTQYLCAHPGVIIGSLCFLPCIKLPLDADYHKHRFCWHTTESRLSSAHRTYQPALILSYMLISLKQSLFCLIPFLFDTDPEKPRGKDLKDDGEEENGTDAKNNPARPAFRSRRTDSEQYIPLSFDSYESTVVNQTPGSTMSRKTSDYYDPYSRKSLGNTYPPKWTTSRNSLDHILLTRMESPGEVQTAGVDSLSDRPPEDRAAAAPSSAPLPRAREGWNYIHTLGDLC